MKFYNIDILLSFKGYLKSSKKMKLTLVLTLLAVMHVCATTFAQRVSISKKNAKLEDIFFIIQQQTNFDFVYSSRHISKATPITIDVKNSDLMEVLDYCFKNQPFSYSVNNRSIIIKDKEGKGQEFRTLSGSVTNENNMALAKVTVRVKGTKNTALTDDKGQFKINIPSQTPSVIVFTFLGMAPKEVAVKDQFHLQVKLQEATDDLEEVEITGYQRIDKRASTSAITSVKVEDIFVPGMNSIEQALEGRIPDLVLMNNSGEVGATPRIRVRGTSTLIGNREPLWVLDGFIMQDPVNVSNEELNDPDYVNIIGNAIQGINPQDIERIDILKDASATALYGTRAANGVIVITTKRGEVGPVRFSYNHSSKFSTRPRYTDRNINLMNSQERVQFGKDLTNLHYKFPDRMPMVGYEGAINRYYKGITDYSQFLDEVSWYETVNTDWFDVLTRNSYSQDHTLGVSGGSEKVRYYFSVGYNPEMGITRGTSTNRYTSLVNLNISLSNRLKADISLNGNVLRKENLASEINAMDYAYNTTRALPAYNEDGSFFYYQKAAYSGMNRSSAMFRYNIFNEMENSENAYDGNTVGASLTLRYNLLNNLDISVAGRYNNSSTLQENWWGERSHYVARLKNGEYEETPKEGQAGYSELPYGGLLNTSNSRQDNYTFRTQFDYRFMLGEDKQHSFNATGGFELNSNTSKAYHDEDRGFVKDRGLQFVENVDLDQYPYYSIWLNQSNRTINNGISRQVSGYASLSYSYKNYFTLNSNGRVDASNKFGDRSNERMLPVWSVSGRWNVKESLFDDWNYISDLSVRSSFGIQGNMLEDQSPNLIIKQGTVDPFYNENIATVERYPNPNLLWEQTKQFNLSTDLSLLENRLNLGLSYYSKKTEDCFTTVQISSVNGVKNNVYVMNGGDIENKGFSINMRGIPIKGENFQWTTSTYFSKNANTVRSGSVDAFEVSDYLNGTVLVDGVPVSTFYSYEFKGLNPRNGTPMFDDYADQQHLMKDKTLEQVMGMVTVNSGQREPIMSGGFANTFKYKQLSLSMNFSYSLGSKMRLFPLFSPIISGVSAEDNVRQEFTQRWLAPGDENFTNIPSLMSPSDPEYLNYFASYSGGASGIPGFASNVWDMYDKSDARVVNGNFLKCQSMSLRYLFTTKSLERTPFSAASFSFNTMNLFTLSSKELKGQDPMQAGFSKPSLSVRPAYTLQFNVSF